LQLNDYNETILLERRALLNITATNLYKFASQNNGSENTKLSFHNSDFKFEKFIENQLKLAKQPYVAIYIVVLFEMLMAINKSIKSFCKLLKYYSRLTTT
jgi:hypothetical protein